MNEFAVPVPIGHLEWEMDIPEAKVFKQEKLYSTSFILIFYMLWGRLRS